MISTYVYKSAGATHEYHQDAYNLTVVTGEGIAGESIHATWGGKGALYAGLGVGTRVESETFLSALKGDFTNPITRQTEHIGGYRKDPATGESVWRHPPGTELVFSGPKSFSIMALSGGDDRLKAAFSLAVERTMAYAERAAGIAKVSIGGNKVDVPTGNLLYADFPHETSRHLDEQLHAHKGILNATYDTTTNQWRALNNHKLMAMVSSGHLDQVFMSELRGLTEQLGYKTEHSPHSAKVGGWELAGIPRAHILEASRSKEAAKAHMRAEGKDYDSAPAHEKQFAHYDSRPDKTRVARPALMSDWQARAERHGVDLAAMRTAALDNTVIREQSALVDTARAHLRDALAATDGKAVLPEQIYADTMTRAAGKTSLLAVDQAYHEAIDAGALHKMAHNGMVSTSREVANTVTRSATPHHLTDAMRRTGNRLAKQHGIDAPKSQDPEVWRAFLNEHSDKRLGMPGRTPSVKTLEARANRDKEVDGKLADMLLEMRGDAGRLAHAQAALETAKLTGAKTAEINKLDKDVAHCKAAGAMLTSRQIGEALIKRHPDIKLTEANKAVERAAEKGKLFATELARKDETPDERTRRMDRYRAGQAKDLAAFDEKQRNERDGYIKIGGTDLAAFDAALKHARTEFTAKQDTLRDRYEARQDSETYTKFSVIDHGAPADAALAKTIEHLKDKVAAGKEAEKDLKEVLADNGGNRDTGIAKALQTKIDDGKAAGKSMTGNQLAEKVAELNPGVDKYAAMRAIDKAAEAGELHKSEHAKQDGSGIYHKFAIEPQESQVDKAQALMAKDREPAEAAKFQSELAKAMDQVEGQVRDKHMSAARLEAHEAGSRYGKEGDPMYHAEYERVMDKAEKKELILDKEDVARAVIRADKAVEGWKERGGAAGDAERAKDREALRQMTSEERQAANKAKYDAVREAQGDRYKKLQRYATNAASPKEWQALRDQDRKAFAAELNTAAKDFEAGWKERMVKAADVSEIKDKLAGEREQFVGKQKEALAALDTRQADRLAKAEERAPKALERLEAEYKQTKADLGSAADAKFEAEWKTRLDTARNAVPALRSELSNERSAFVSKQRAELGTFEAKQANKLGSAHDRASVKLGAVQDAYKDAKSKFEGKQKEQVDKWEQSRERLDQKVERSRANQWKLPSMAIKTRNTGVMYRDRGIGRGVYRAEMSFSNAMNYLTGNKDQLTYKRVGLVHGLLVRTGRVGWAVGKPVLRVAKRLLQKGYSTGTRATVRTTNWLGKKAMQNINALAAEHKSKHQFEKAAKTLGMTVEKAVTKAPHQDIAKAKALGHATKSIGQKGDRWEGKTKGQDFLVEMFGSKEQKAELAARLAKEQKLDPNKAQNQQQNKANGQSAAKSSLNRNRRHQRVVPG